ncbi:Hypothetical predicted protein [Mytilus galloprovincialis]|uniref:Uncharacterized protein n=1 Tax=Mytilus galloprovincialis TaxID=29158 RepID=A0A8B6ETS9_MYTGA|nr:Hypothetical predicted protein [Mytilus galloprovincialis]
MLNVVMFVLVLSDICNSAANGLNKTEEGVCTDDSGCDNVDGCVNKTITTEPILTTVTELVTVTDLVWNTVKVNLTTYMPVSNVYTRIQNITPPQESTGNVLQLLEMKTFVIKDDEGIVSSFYGSEKHVNKSIILHETDYNKTQMSSIKIRCFWLSSLFFEKTEREDHQYDVTLLRA